MSGYRVAIDEGGVRHTHGAMRRYFPWEEIADIELRTRLFRNPVVLIHDQTGAEHILFVGPDALEIHRALAEHVGVPRSDSENPWPRHGQPIGEWLAALDSGGYRDDGRTRALAILEDALAPIEARAAAAHFLVRYADGDALIATAKVLAGRALPPLVLAAARLAGAVEDASGFAPFLDPADRDAVLTSGTPGIRFGAIAAEARRQLENEAQREVHAHPAAKRRSPLAGSDRDPSRWVGKNWGL